MSKSSRGGAPSAACRACLVAGAVSLLANSHANAFEFQLSDEVSGKLSTSVTFGSIIRTEDANHETLAPANAASVGKRGTAQDSNFDDGNLNFKKGQPVSTVLKSVSDFSLDYQNYGLFARAKAWYDYTLENSEVEYGHFPNGYRPNRKLDDSDFDNLAKFKGVALLDAYVYGGFELGERPLEVRLGNMGISWGESLFFVNGINTVNPIDVAALRKPGVQAKEAFLPSPMAYINYGVTDNLSLEAFYQLRWQKTVLDGCGTYFATTDVAAEGCDGLFLDPSITDQAALDAGFFMPRANDREPRDSGQFGTALRYFSEDLGTDFGLYYLQYHSRTPFLGAFRPAPAAGKPFGEYTFDYPEAIRLFGASFATNLAGYSVFGELSFRPNAPLALEGSDLLAASLGLPGVLAADAATVGPGGHLKGYDRKDVTQLSLGTIKNYYQVLGASQLSLIAEAAFSWVGGLPDVEQSRYGRPEAYGQARPHVSTLGGCVSEKSCSHEGYVSDFAWGFVTRASLDYPNVFAGVNLLPKLAYSHDVKGWSWDGAFSEGRHATSLALEANYQSTYTAELGYTRFMGGKYNLTKDRDFLSFTVGYSF